MYEMMPNRRGFLGMRSGVEDLVDQMFSDVRWPRGFFSMDYSAPLEQLKETENDYTLSVKIPGIDREKLSVTYDNNVLTIQAQDRMEEENVSEDDGVVFHTRKFQSTNYNRSWKLPTGVDPESIRSKYKDGILEIVVPKPQEIMSESKRIDINYEK
jgi:HSP20 family protein